MSPIAISPYASYYHYDVIVIMTSRAYGARSPRSHYDVIGDWAGHAHRYGCTYTLKPNSITLASSELATNMFEAGSYTLKPNSITLAGSELALNKLRTSFERAPN